MENYVKGDDNNKEEEEEEDDDNDNDEDNNSIDGNPRQHLIVHIMI